MSRFVSTALMLLAAACLTASAQQNTPAQPASPAAQPASQSPAQSASTESNVVVARISGEPITEKQVLAAIQDLASRKLIMTPEQQKQRNTILFKGAIDNLIVSTVLKSEARRLNVAVDKAKVDQQMQEFAKRYKSQEEFRKALADQGVAEADLRKSVEDSLSMQEVINIATKDVPEPSEEELKKFYEGNPQLFAVPERVHCAQIFLRIDPTSTPEQKAEVRKKLEQIHADIEAKNISFADAAAKFSQDPGSASKGGDAGWVARNETSKDLAEVIFSTPVGTTTQVIEDQAGFRLIQVTESKPAGTKNLEESKTLIKQMLGSMAKQRALQKYIEDLKSKAVVENFMTPEEFDKRHPVK